jgi:hypothetical protein
MNKMRILGNRRRSSSIFEMDFSEIRDKGSSLLRDVMESRDETRSESYAIEIYNAIENDLRW